MAAAGFERLTLDTTTDRTAAVRFDETLGNEAVARGQVAAADTTPVCYEKRLP